MGVMSVMVLKPVPEKNPLWSLNNVSGKYGK